MYYINQRQHLQPKGFQAPTEVQHLIMFKQLRAWEVGVQYIVMYWWVALNQFTKN